MPFPKYNGDSTVNLIASMQSYCGIIPQYEQLSLLPSDQIKESDTVILCLIDAMGYKWIEKYAQDSFLSRHMKGYIHSAFPSTTSTAITTFSTGLTPSEHAILGWNMFSKEVGGTIQVLPWRYKILGTSLGDTLNIEQITTQQNFYQKSNKEVYIVTNQAYQNSQFNTLYNRDATVFGYGDMSGFFSQIEYSMQVSQQKKYIYAYWGDFDSISHQYGIDSIELRDHFRKIDYGFELLSKKLEGTNTKIIITADHGQVNIPLEMKIDISVRFPQIVDMLIFPLSGDPRCQYCFVKSEEINHFRSYVEQNMSDMCCIYSKAEVIEKQIFGYGNNPKFLERIGDYVLIAKENYALFHTSQNDSMYDDFGFHGGVSDWETLVPLIVI